MTKPQTGARRDRDEANRKDSFILHRFESILSWVESMNLNRSVDDDDDEHAQKAADDQDNITLSKVDKRAATRLRCTLICRPKMPTMKRWQARSPTLNGTTAAAVICDDHCRVLEAPAGHWRNVRAQRSVASARCAVSSKPCAHAAFCARARLTDQSWI